MIRLLILFVFSLACIWGQVTTPATSEKVSELKRDLEKTRTEIQDAMKRDEELAGGLVKALIAVRIEILKTNEALLEQRINAVEGGAPIRIETLGTVINEEEAAILEKEIQAKRQEVILQQKDAEQYSGGLVLAMKRSTIATNENSIALLEQRRLIAKYGLFYRLPSPSEGSKPPSGTTKKQPDLSPSEDIIAVKIISKEFVKANYQEYIRFDIEWNPINLKKPARSVKGIIHFCDLFGSTKFLVSYTVNNPLIPGQVLISKGGAIKYNQFDEKENWVRGTDLEDMLFKFKVTDILYTDGEKERIDQ